MNAEDEKRDEQKELFLLISSTVPLLGGREEWWWSNTPHTDGETDPQGDEVPAIRIRQFNSFNPLKK